MKGAKLKKASTKQRTHVQIPVGVIEFYEGGNTMWIQSPQGGTTMRIKCTGKIKIDQCKNSPMSHCDLIVDGDIEFCVSTDSNNSKTNP